MSQEILRELKLSLAKSDAEFRKFWAHKIVESEWPLTRYFGLFHHDQKTAQRFMWLIGDICELQPERVTPCMPILFSLRDQMPFPGMRRSVAKWLGLTQVPPTVEKEAIPQLFRWMGDKTSSIGCKSYTAKALSMLATQKRIPKHRLKRVLRTQIDHENRAFGSRMQKLLSEI